jgi:hypothetical protein
VPRGIFNRVFIFNKLGCSPDFILSFWPAGSSDKANKNCLRNRDSLGEAGDQRRLAQGQIIGVLLAINGLGWMIDSLRPYLFPTTHLGFVFITFFGELVFMFWLLIRGWKIQEPITRF